MYKHDKVHTLSNNSTILSHDKNVIFSTMFADITYLLAFVTKCPVVSLPKWSPRTPHSALHTAAVAPQLCSPCPTPPGTHFPKCQPLFMHYNSTKHFWRTNFCLCDISIRLLNKNGHILNLKLLIRTPELSILLAGDTCEIYLCVYKLFFEQKSSIIYPIFLVNNSLNP